MGNEWLNGLEIDAAISAKAILEFWIRNHDFISLEIKGCEQLRSDGNRPSRMICSMVGVRNGVKCFSFDFAMIQDGLGVPTLSSKICEQAYGKHSVYNYTTELRQWIQQYFKSAIQTRKGIHNHKTNITSRHLFLLPQLTSPI